LAEEDRTLLAIIPKPSFWDSRRNIENNIIRAMGAIQ
jgi:hypothetical protein